MAILSLPLFSFQNVFGLALKDRISLLIFIHIDTRTNLDYNATVYQRIKEILSCHFNVSLAIWDDRV